MNAERGANPLFVGVDVGGTNIKAGIVNNAGESLAQLSVLTEAQRGPDIGIETIVQLVRDIVSAAGLTLADIAAVGLATPGTMDIPEGMLIDPPNLPGWNNLPIRQRVANALQKPTYLQNDANAAAYGEWWVGAGRDVNSLVMWTLGTGIGCGIIVGDMIVRGEHSHGSECGHIIIELENGRRCDTGQFGTLEAYAGAKALVRRCQEALAEGRNSVLRDLVDSGEELTPLAIANAAEQGDKLADDLIMETARCLGVGTTTVMHTVDPNMVLFGGAMTFGRNETELGRRFLARIKQELQVRAFPVLYRETIVDYAALGGDAGYIGAAGYARQKYHQALGLVSSDSQ